MAHNSNLPCDGEGVCMVCKEKPSDAEMLTCKTCVTPWHASCLSDSAKPQTLTDSAVWECPDCTPVASDENNNNNLPVPPPPPVVSGGSQDLIASIRAIEADSSLTDQEKAKRRQELLSGKAKSTDDEEKEEKNAVNDVLDLLDESFNCSFCMQLPERPVTTPCGHNFCLKCFERWTGQGKRTCAKCRDPIPPTMARQPRINSALVIAIRMAKLAKANGSSSSRQPKVYHNIHNQNRPDKAFTTERAKKSGKANACSGKIFVTIPKDYFGPITAEYDPERNRGVLVGDSWEDRMECRQWGAHFPHVSGIAGQSEYGAQSVALSGGYLDDEDHGEWFLYTGSGGRDLSGNKRTNKDQSFDQKFDKGNEALRLSCRKGYPIRVVRSFKEKRSSYAPEKGVRYDGVYRVEKCWRKVGIQGHKVCRYLFVRCDNEPAPWTCDDHGDLPRQLPEVKELDGAVDITERKGSPAWDYDEEKACWMWKKPLPISRKQYDDDGDKTTRGVKRQASVKNKLLKEFSCLTCRKVMVSPLTTPCAHNFCKACLEGAFAGQSFIKQRTCEGRRSLRAQKNIMRCPSCKNDISDFLQNPQVNRELMNVIERLQRQIEEENAANEDIVDDTIAEDLEVHDETLETGSDVNVSEEADDGDNETDMVAETKEKCDADVSEEADDGDNEIDMVAGDKENCDVNATILEEDKDSKEITVKSLINIKPELKVANTESSESEEVQVAASVSEAKRTSKRKKAADATDSSTPDAGVQTRNKKTKSGAR